MKKPLRRTGTLLLAANRDNCQWRFREAYFGSEHIGAKPARVNARLDYQDMWDEGYCLEVEAI